jgi:hypothetical protein
MDCLLPLGVRASLACATLKTLGSEDVASLEGGNARKEAGSRPAQRAGLPSDEYHDGL